jgi:hypothetical protein
MLFEVHRDHPQTGSWQSVVDVRPKEVIFVDLAYAKSGQGPARPSNSDFNGVEKVRLLPGICELLTGSDARLFEEDILQGIVPKGAPPGMGIAWEKIDDGVMWSMETLERIRFKEETYWLPEAVCIRRAFFALHEMDIQGKESIHVHACPETFHVFVYKNAKLVFYQAEMYEGEAANLKVLFKEEICSRIQGSALLYLSGFRPDWQFEEADWMWGSFESAGITCEVRWVEPGRNIKANPSLANFGEANTGFAAYQTPLTFFGAALMLQDGWGADFGGALPPIPVSAPSRFTQFKNRFAAAAQMAPPFVAGSLVALALTAIPLGVTFRTLQKERSVLEARLAQEKLRETELEGLKKKADEIHSLIAGVEGINAEIKKQLPLQKLPSEALAALRETWVRGVVLKKVSLKDGRIDLAGEVTFGALYGSLRKGGEADQNEPAPFFDAGSVVAQYALNLKQNQAFGDVVANTKTVDAQKTEFTISCLYSGGKR